MGQTVAIFGPTDIFFGRWPMQGNDRNTKSVEPINRSVMSKKSSRKASDTVKCSYKHNATHYETEGTSRVSVDQGLPGRTASRKLVNRFGVER